MRGIETSCELCAETIFEQIHCRYIAGFVGVSEMILDEFIILPVCLVRFAMEIAWGIHQQMEK